jgi:hypothetical protein
VDEAQSQGLNLSFLPVGAAMPWGTPMAFAVTVAAVTQDAGCFMTRVGDSWSGQEALTF